jgi:predicted ATP-dependent serine protease
MARSSNVIPPDQGENLTNEQRINLLLHQKTDNDTILYNLTRFKHNLAAIERDDERVKIANKFGVVAPKHDALFRQRLMEQIRKCKHRYLSECQELSALDMLRDDDGTARHVSEIERIHSPRFSLGLNGVDEVLGTDPVSGTEGLPRGACLIFGAPKGMGKTRLTVQIAAAVGHPDYPPDEEMDLNGVLFIQNEEKVEVFLGRNGKSWTNKHNILLSSSDNLTQHESLINEHRPRLVIVDSIQDTRQARFSSGITTILTTYKAMATSLGTSFWLISHVNGKGKIKGGTYPGHKVDIEMIAHRNKFDPAEFIIACDEKNRYGATGKRAVFRHMAEGIISVAEVGDLTRFGYKEE